MMSRSNSRRPTHRPSPARPAAPFTGDAVDGRGHVDVRLPAGALSGRFNALVSEHIRPFLRDRGFARSGPAFSRRRGSLYDVISFQGSQSNGLEAMQHKFYVNVGIGSVEIDGGDGTSPRTRPKLEDCLVRRRWERVADGAPSEVDILPDSDPDEVAELVRHWLGHVVAFLESLDRTDVLVDLAIDGNALQEMQKTCAYLARTEDVERLRRYVGALRDRFSAETRWTILNRQIARAVGPYAGELLGTGLLDELS